MVEIGRITYNCVISLPYLIFIHVGLTHLNPVGERRVLYIVRCLHNGLHIDIDGGELKLCIQF